LTWVRGRARIEQLLADRELEIVTASKTHAGRLVDEAERHLASAKLITQEDPTGAYQLAYDAARKACSALLAVQGLRATTKGGHIAIQDAVREQFGGPAGVKAFDALGRMRRQRAASEYPGPDTPTITADDTIDAISTTTAILTATKQLLDTNRLDPFQIT
jgi:hypothetical protein